MQTSLPLENRRAAASFRSGALFAGFVLTGIITTLLGPILPYLALRWNLDDSHSGLLFTAQFVGSMAGVLLSSPILSRLGPRIALVTGYAASGLGVAALSAGSWTVGMILVGCFGFGLGLIIPTTNLLVAEAYPHRRAASLSTLNMTWGLGAVLWPLLAAVVVKRGHVSATLLTLGSASILFCLLFGKIDNTNLSRTHGSGSRISPAGYERFEYTAIAVMGLLFFLYVGTENCLGGWVASLGRRLHTGAGMDWVLLPSFFWGGLLLGRGLAPIALKRIHEIVLVRGCLLLALLGTLVVIGAHDYSWLVAGASLSGLGLSAVFPITVSQFSLRFGESAVRYLGGMFALSSLGGATLPWLVGFVSNRSGSLRMGIFVPAVAIVFILLLYVGRFSARPCEPARD